MKGRKTLGNDDCTEFDGPYVVRFIKNSGSDMVYANKVEDSIFFNDIRLTGNPAALY